MLVLLVWHHSYSYGKYNFSLSIVSGSLVQRSVPRQFAHPEQSFPRTEQVRSGMHAHLLQQGPQGNRCSPCLRCNKVMRQVYSTVWTYVQSLRNDKVPKNPAMWTPQATIALISKYEGLHASEFERWESQLSSLGGVGKEYCGLLSS